MGRRSSLDVLSDKEALIAKLHTLSDVELIQVSDLIEDLELARYRSTPNESSEDELVTTLAVAPENVRARQVYAWEQLRRQALRHSNIP